MAHALDSTTRSIRSGVADDDPPRAASRDGMLERLTDLFLAEGFLGFGVGDLAARLSCSRSTLYRVADSKQGVITAVVRSYFREATARVEEEVAADPDPRSRISTYLHAVSTALAPASDAFYADLAAFPPAAEIYANNTAHAARRVRELVDEGVRAGVLRAVDARFVGAAVAQVMEAIQSGAMRRSSGLNDAQCYALLADLVVNGVSAAPSAGRRPS